MVDGGLQMKGDKDRVLECTTSSFDGLIAVVNPEDSWVVSGQTGKHNGQADWILLVLLILSIPHNALVCSPGSISAGR